MIINKLDNITYQIKLPNKKINIYNKYSLEEITKKIFKKIAKKEKLNPILILDVYEEPMYGTIITLKHYMSMFNINNEYEVKIENNSVVSEVFKKISHHNITKFVVEEPSLNEIFIAKVGAIYDE